MPSPPVLYRYSSLFFSLYRSDRGHTIKRATGAAIQVKEHFPLWLNISKPPLIRRLSYIRSLSVYPFYS
ncbi:hypothetical protein CJZ71_14275 [Bacillus subtilis]|nr:hypothetical protein CJZ70_18180 [Bacillus subtilis]AYK66357.1 hypothetical protein D9C11_13335 [Bacillus subtilis subsp. subtilis]ASV03210.1 hypothetical protein CJZ71_14275 [Bacillus subtilis]AYK69230.1 hypothetical protein D9C09_05350 [Bacillus subtilis subsp. subtilis]AYK72983.1 hypothetical protein D9C12_03450 [Bacillus subtilis subsp. subtilis]